MSDSSSPLLRVRDIEKAFPGVRALSGVSFDVRAGEVHALLGENGAGKSTLIKIVSGVYQPDGGAILIDGRETRFSTPDDAKRAGVATRRAPFSRLRGEGGAKRRMRGGRA